MSVFEPPGKNKQTRMIRFHALARVFEVFKKIRFNLSVRVFDFCIFYHSLSSGLIAGGNAWCALSPGFHLVRADDTPPPSPGH